MRRNEGPSPGLRPPSPRVRGEGARSADEGRRFRSALAVALLLLTSVAFADSEADRRTDAAVRMFGSVLAADVDLQKKTVDDGKVLLVVYFTSDAVRAEKLAASLRVTASGEPKKIGGLPVVVETSADASFKSFAKRAPAGIFLAQSPDPRTLKSIVQWGVAHHVIVYSPFEGHVESGVFGGLSIGAQVKPYVNLATMQASQISLKSIFMKVTKVYQ